MSARQDVGRENGSVLLFESSDQLVLIGEAGRKEEKAASFVFLYLEMCVVYVSFFLQQMSTTYDENAARQSRPPDVASELRRSPPSFLRAAFRTDRRCLAYGRSVHICHKCCRNCDINV